MPLKSHRGLGDQSERVIGCEDFEVGGWRMITPEEARRIQTILEHSEGQPIEERLKRVRAEMPHATDADIKRAFKSKMMLDDLGLVDVKADKAAAEKLVQLLERVEALSGKSNMNAEEAIAICLMLAGRGNAEARELKHLIEEALKDPFF